MQGGSWAFVHCKETPPQAGRLATLFPSQRHWMVTAGVGNREGVTPWAMAWQILLKENIQIPCDSTIASLDIYPRKMRHTLAKNCWWLVVRSY